MRIGILGGTGNMGRGLALRLSLKHEVTIGSRSAEKAVEVAVGLQAKASGFYTSAMIGRIGGALNEDAVLGRDIMINTLPASAAVSALADVKDKLSPCQVVVSCVVPMARRGKLFTWSPVVVAACEEGAPQPSLYRTPSPP